MEHVLQNSIINICKNVNMLRIPSSLSSQHSKRHMNMHHFCTKSEPCTCSLCFVCAWISS